MNKDNVINDNEINPEYFEVNDDLEDTLDLTEILKNGDENGRKD